MEAFPPNQLSLVSCILNSNKLILCMPGNKCFFINTEKIWRLFDLYACLMKLQSIGGQKDVTW